MLDQLLLQPLNRLIRSENWARLLLQGHAGKGAELKIGPATLRFLIADDGLLLPLADGVAPAVCISMPADALGDLLSGGPDALVARAQLSGDAGLADALARLIRHLRPDLGAALSPVLGRVLANRVEQGAGKALATLQDGAQRLSANLREYLAEGVAPAITQRELESLAEGNRALAARLDRLEARLPRQG
ncbi:MAG: hypothetical protein QM776_10095 [Rhodocyclaceae bacterium]